MGGEGRGCMHETVTCLAWLAGQLEGGTGMDASGEDISTVHNTCPDYGRIHGESLAVHAPRLRREQHET